MNNNKLLFYFLLPLLIFILAAGFFITENEKSGDMSLEQKKEFLEKRGYKVSYRYLNKDLKSMEDAMIRELEMAGFDVVKPRGPYKKKE